ncbi:DUF2946 domain-containing protein [Marinomonas hwangdonensis]|uniref:DUF2946 domain-containing protein n=1 Tax=Marinomonas hwangdonensis TaxID=1053647 RepID=A0A3M8Q9F1_9GAMM|nr:DUF2946 domain-containing protein [Marinomonas hwangdonensis]RNF52697.1 DUF2946 domain-containing protein [Marinomonas hwangdonensis]
MATTVNTKAATIAKVCLFSILMLTFGPFIGQIKTPAMSPLLMHDMSNMVITQFIQQDRMTASDEHHDHHERSAGMAMDHSVMDPDAWDEQCGYCSLSHNFPFIHNTVSLALGVSPLPFSAFVEWIRSAFNVDSLFLLALKRAPPISHE